jgi:tetratricopeptide (TPR) repeat protein
MPATTYMVVDPRHDHSLRVPRPDLSVTLGTPNACTNCHKDRDARWAATTVNAWYGHEPQGYQRFAEAFAASGDGARDGQALMRHVAEAASQPAIARATAFESLDASTGQATIDALAKGLRDPNALVRLGAVQALAGAPLNVRASLAGPLLSDPLKALRIEAASLLAPLAVDQRGLSEPSAFGRASSEFVESQRYNADRPEGRVNIGTFYGNRGDTAKSEDEIRAAIRLDPFFLPAYVNLADLYRVTGRDADGEHVLRQGLAVAPQSGALHHALGLALVRLKRTDEALQEFERATVLEPHNARFTYVYGVALHSTGHAEAAVSTLEKGLLAHPGDSNIVAALASFRAGRGGSATRP